MTLRDQIEASTNAANTSAVWKHLKLLERERERDADITSTRHRQRETASAASHVYDEKRKGWLMLVTVMIEIVKWISK